MANISQKWLNELEVFVPFTSNYAAKMYGSELARIAKIPQKTASRRLNEYFKRSFIKSIQEGKNKLYYFNLKETKSVTLIKTVELYKSMKFFAENLKIGLLMEELAKNNPIVLFGSYTKGYATKKSDIDLLIIGKKSNRIKKVIKRYPFKINEHYSSYKNFEKMLKGKNTLAKEISKNHIFFGEVDYFVDIIVRNS
jgi:predicted nucleotidyltransferase|tara:strand:- start:570 stop:1157 length:588 start_codon:yes stop_codon:yes gene_type:complete